jgi:hypothetical protein
MVTWELLHLEAARTRMSNMLRLQASLPLQDLHVDVLAERLASTHTGGVLSNSHLEVFLHGQEAMQCRMAG